MTPDPMYVEMMLLRTGKVYTVNANMAHMRLSNGGDYKLIVDECSPRIEIPYKRIRELVSYGSTTVMTPDILAGIKTRMEKDVRVMVRSTSTRDNGLVFLEGTVIPDKCITGEVAVVLTKDDTLSTFPPEEVIIRDGGPISERDPIYLRWVQERSELLRGKRGA